MNELFLEKLDDFIINQDNSTIRKSIKDFWDENYQNIFDNEDFLLSKLQEYAPSNNWDFAWFFYRYLYFFLFKDENNYYSKKIVDFLKKELIEQSNTEKPEFYSNILSVIFKIEWKKSKEEFYQRQYKNIDKKWYLYSDISTSFLKIFIQLWINNKNVLPEFSNLFQKVIIQSVDEIISSSIQDWWDYLISLEKNIFNKEFINLINYFNTEEIRWKLVHHHKYTSLFTLWKYENDTKRFSKIREKIEDYFWEDEYVIFENFIISEVSYVLDIHERAIEKNIFISQGIDILQKKDWDFIIKLLKNLDTEKTLWWLENTIVKYININQVEEFISIIKDTDNSFTIFRVYETLKEENNTSFIEAFDKSSYKDELQKIQKKRDENQDKSSKEKEKRISKEKGEFLSMIQWLEEWQYYPKLFEDYAEYCSSNNTRFSIYTEKEKEKIDNELIRQIKVYLSYRKVEKYTQKWLDFVTFEKKEENSYSHCWDVRYMTRFLEIAQKLPEVKKVLKENYKSVLLFYPLMYTNETEDFFFNEILSKKIEKEDIDYILKAFNSDLHENAKDLRYYHPGNFSNFYKKFKTEFVWFEKQLEKISLQMILEKEKVAVYYRESYLEIYADAVWEIKYRKYWNKEKKQFPDFNYFTDILKNQHEKSWEELREMRFFLMIQTVLIEKYVKKSDIVWRIQQFKWVELKYKSILDREYPHYNWVTTFSWGSPLSEIEWSSFDRENFAYIFSLDSVWKIDISKEILGVLEESLKIKSLDNKQLDLYANYLQKIFFKYFEILDCNYFNKYIYEEVNKIVNSYSMKITYNFNLDFFRNKLILTNYNNLDLSKEDIKDILQEKMKQDEKYKKLFNQYILLKDENQKDNQYKESINRDIVIIVEWVSDINILNTAWEKLYGNKKQPFIIQNGYDKWNIRSMFNRDIDWIVESDDRKTFIGILDYDEAYSDFEGLGKKQWEIKNNNDLEWKLKKKNWKKWYVFLLPIPIERKMYANQYFKSNSLVSIELLFSDEIILKKNKHGDYVHVKEILNLPWNHNDPLYKFEKKKILFSENCYQYDKESFKNFKPIFELINKIINWDFEDKKKTQRNNL